MKQNIEDGKIGGAAIATAENIINTGHEGTAIDCYLLQTANDCRGDANNPVNMQVSGVSVRSRCGGEQLTYTDHHHHQ